MKHLNLILKSLLLLLLFQTVSLGQNVPWAVKAVRGDGNFYDIKAIDKQGNMIDVIALNNENGNQFMDIKVKSGNDFLPVKMIISNDYYVPVKAITQFGEIYDIKAVGKDGKKLDVKGVTRAGNTIMVAALTPSNKFLKVKAISPEGIARNVYGVKFKEDNIEMEIGKVKVLAHIKALPSPQVNTTQLVWTVMALDLNGNSMPLYAMGKNGKEYGVKALVVGGSYHLLDVKAIANWNEITIKLMKEGDKITLAAINDMGDILPVKAKTGEGKYLAIEGFHNQGKTYNIKAIGSDGQKYSVKAVSDDGDLYDVKGVKTKFRDEEGELLGIKYSHFFFAHVKAFPQVQ